MPEPWGSQYDIRAMLNSTAVLRDGERLKLPRPIEEALERTDIGALLRRYGLMVKSAIQKGRCRSTVGGSGRGDEVDDDAVTVVVRKTPPRALDVL